MTSKHRSSKAMKKLEVEKLKAVDSGPIVTKDEIMKAKEALIEEHLPPLSLSFIIVLCSGFLLMLSLRDFLTTGKTIYGSWDDKLLSFTKSTQWYDDSKGWKSTLGGFSAVRQMTTDKNNMGGFFIRKLGGAAGISVQLQKLIPFLVHPKDSQWIMGHFRLLLWTALVSNLFIVGFYASYLDILKLAGAHQLPLAIMSVLCFESICIFLSLVTAPKAKRGVAVALTAGKTPSSSPSNIVRNTCLIVTTFFSIIAARDLFLPGYIIELIPRDDIYLEWTNALLHSPPEGSPEAVDQGLTAPLYIGDKFISQLTALLILINCLYKYVSTLFIRYGSDGSGMIKARMIWRAQTIGCILISLVYRIFTSAAASAHLDMRWHIMLLVYETIILITYGYL